MLERYRLLCWHQARRLVPPRDVDDAVQDALLGIVRGYGRWRADGGASLDRWLWLSIRAAIIDGARSRTQYRRNVKRRPIVVSLDEPIGYDDNHGAVIERCRADYLEADRAEPDLELVAVDLEHFLRELDLGGDPADRIVLDGLLDGRSQEAIAADLGVTPSRISQRVRNIRRHVEAAM